LTRYPRWLPHPGPYFRSWDSALRKFRQGAKANIIEEVTPLSWNSNFASPAPARCVPHVALEAIKAATINDFEPNLASCNTGEAKTRKTWRYPTARVPGAGWPTAGQLNQIVSIVDSSTATARGRPAPASPDRARWHSRILPVMNNTVHPTSRSCIRPRSFAESEAAQAEVKKAAQAR